MRIAGTTLLELTLALALLGVMLLFTLVAFARPLDRLAVRAAAAEIVLACARTRVEAIGQGADLLIAAGPAVFWVEAHGARVSDPVDLGREYGVTISAGGVDTVRLAYSPLGLGNVTSHTLRVRRGGAEARVSVSTYGRARAW